jgi:ATP-dependent Clp protease ATP-binding subunit ClpA
MTVGAKVGRIKKVPIATVIPTGWDKTFADGVIGQDHAVESITSYVRAHTVNMSPSGRPAGVFLLMGPTGVGKTWTVEALAKALHDDHKNYLHIDCAEYQYGHNIARLTGAPPGFLGFKESAPLLTQARLSAVASHRSSLSLVLFDEIEKADDELFQLLLGILDKGTFRLGDNSLVDFTNSMVFFTSNLGAKEIANTSVSWGFTAGERNRKSTSQLETISERAAKKHFTPEFLNRVDEMFTYRPLTRENIRHILDHQLRRLSQELEFRGVVRLLFGDDIKKYLIARGYDPNNGAREMRRTIQRLVQQPLAALIERGSIDKNEKIQVSVDKGKVTFYRYNAMEQTFEEVG